MDLQMNIISVDTYVNMFTDVWTFRWTSLVLIHVLICLQMYGPSDEHH